MYIISKQFFRQARHFGFIELTCRVLTFQWQLVFPEHLQTTPCRSTFGLNPVWSDSLHFQEHRVPSSKIAFRFNLPTPAEPKFSKVQNCSKNEVSEVILTGSASCSAGDQDCRFPISSSRLFKTFPPC